MRFENDMGLDKNTTTSIALGIANHAIAGGSKGVPGPAPYFEFDIDAGTGGGEADSHTSAVDARYPVAHRQSA